MLKLYDIYHVGEMQTGRQVHICTRCTCTQPHLSPGFIPFPTPFHSDTQKVLILLPQYMHVVQTSASAIIVKPLHAATPLWQTESTKYYYASIYYYVLCITPNLFEARFILKSSLKTGWAPSCLASFRLLSFSKINFKDYT